jgi:hypothetical protein
MLGKECRTVVLAIVVSLDGSYHLEVLRHHDEPRTQTYDNATYTATVSALPKLFEDPALSDLQGRKFRVVF